MAAGLCELRGCIAPATSEAPLCAAHLGVVAGQVRRAMRLADWLGLGDECAGLGRAVDDLAGAEPAQTIGARRAPWAGERCTCGRTPQAVAEIAGHGAVPLCGAAEHGSALWDWPATRIDLTEPTEPTNEATDVNDVREAA